AVFNSVLSINAEEQTVAYLTISKELHRNRFYFQAEDGIRDRNVTGVQTCALPISNSAGYPKKPSPQGCGKPWSGIWGSAKTAMGDRKSTRLNSSHVSISYAVFCLKKKKITSFETRSMLATVWIPKPKAQARSYQHY